MKNINIKDLTLENLADWPNVVKIAVVVIVSLVALAASYWFLVKGIFEQYDILKEQEATLRTEFETKQRQAANLEGYRKQLATMQVRFGDMLRKLPSKNEMPGILEDISKTGVASGLTFLAFEPQQEVVHDFYIELPINITVLGDYKQLATFLSRVAQMSRIVTLHDFSIDVPNADKQKAGSGEVLNMKITAKIYRYRSL